MVLSEILQAVMDMANSTNPYAKITSGALPANNGITMTYSFGSPIETYRNRSDNYSMSIVLNGKHKNQKTVLDTLTNIHKHLTRAYNYPSSDEWQVYAIETTSAPSYLDKETDGAWLYGSSLRIKFYWRNNNG